MRFFKCKISISKTYKRFFISFLVVLFLPMIFFVSLFMKSYYKIYSEDIIKQASNSLDAAGMEVERNIESLQLIAIYNSLSEQISKQVVLNDYTGKKIMSILGVELATHPALESISYYNQANPNVIYTEMGTYSVLYYAKLFLEFESDEKFMESLQHIQRDAWFCSNKDDKDSFQYVIRGSKDEWWIFTISGKTFGEIVYAENAVTVLKDKAGNTIYSIGEQIGERPFEIVFDSSKGHFQLIRYLDRGILYAELNAWQKSFYGTVAIVLLIGGILVMVLTHYNEYPIKKLMEYCVEKVQSVPKDLEGIEVFRFAMKSMEEKVLLSEKKIRISGLLLRLIYDHDCDAESFKTALKAEGLLQKAECYRVVLAVPLDESEITLKKVVQYMNVQDNGEYEIHIISRLTEAVIVMIVGMSESADKKLREELLYMTDAIKENVEEEINIYIGGKCTQLNQIHTSYVQAIYCVHDYCRGKKNPVVYYNVSNKAYTKFRYPNEELNTLYDTLIEINLKKARMVTEKLIRKLKECNENMYVSVPLYYDVLNTYYRAWMRLGIDEKADFLESDLCGIRDQIEVSQMIQRIEDQYQDYAKRIKEKFDAKECRTTVEELITNVVTYIDENSKSRDLNVSMVADHFGISISHLSKSFMQKINCKISDYIMEKKFSYACELLKETEYSVKEIAVMIGYHPVSFNRKYKERYGMSPAEHRGKIRGGQREKL